jgi:hypothetical protein
MDQFLRKERHIANVARRLAAVHLTHASAENITLSIVILAAAERNPFPGPSKLSAARTNRLVRIYEFQIGNRISLMLPKGRT